MTNPSPSMTPNLPPNLPPISAQVAAIDQCLPQTQCAQCDWPGCLAYARAIHSGQADINQCPPGGTTTITALAQLLNRAPKPLSPKHGTPQPLRLARIDEQGCIGCALCIKACPVDSIVGAAKLMHTVIADECTGCELCLPVCPTDCIVMTESVADAGQPSMWHQLSRRRVEKARQRAQHKRARLNAQERARAQRKVHRRRPAMQAEILAAVRRKQAQARPRPW